MQLIQEKTFQFPKGLEQPHPTANHLFEGRKNCTPAATPRPAEASHRTLNASGKRRTLILLIIHT